MDAVTTPHCLDAAEPNPLPRTNEFITQLLHEYGADYNLKLAAVVEVTNRDDKARYMSAINAAINILTRDKSTAEALVVDHLATIFAALDADLQSSNHHEATVQDPALSHDGRDRPVGDISGEPGQS
ncbi:hypothetical protein [Nocardia sp. NPDC049707]|uniref:hypothetical protein n=1 Tax=Nocardia sp. NPDC049707 TaxID=3154735 RepID=UPI0034386E79